MSTWTRPTNPPPPLFLGRRERDYTKQVNDEVIERVIGQQILYYPINLESSNFHSLYGESIEKNFLPPVHVQALIKLENIQTTFNSFGADKESRILINFHKRRLTEDQNLFVREGDFVRYGDRMYEIVNLAEPRELFGQADHRFEIAAVCIQARKGLFMRPEPTGMTRIRQLVRQRIGDIIVGPPPEPGRTGEVEVFCPLAGSEDATILFAYASNPGLYFGKIIYIAKLDDPLVVTIPPFIEQGKFYFNEVGVWFPSPFILFPDTTSYDVCEDD
jgi:hypothetical protein